MTTAEGTNYPSPTSTVREEHNRNNSLPVSGLISASGLYHQAPDLYVGYPPRLAPSSQTQECRILH